MELSKFEILLREKGDLEYPSIDRKRLSLISELNDNTPITPTSCTTIPFYHTATNTGDVGGLDPHT